MPQNSPDFSRRVGSWASHLRWHDLPEPVRDRAADALRDTVAVMFGGAGTTAARLGAAYARTGPGGVPLAAGGSAAPDRAAFANATAATALDFEDGHYLGGGIHPGSIVVAAGLAAAPAGTTVRDFLTAQVAGYEVGLRAGALLWPRHSGDWYHCTGTAGSLGAAATAARLRGLDGEAVTRALVLAWQHAPMATFALPMAKESIGWGASVGVAAAELARAGYLALPAGYTPPAPPGFAATPFDVPGAEKNEIVASLGEEFEAGRTYFKAYACCRYIHAAAHGLGTLMDRLGIGAGEIEEIEVRTHAGALFLSEQDPRTLEHAQYSFPHVLAAVALEGAAGARQINEDRLGDPSRAALARRVRVTHAPDLDDAPPPLTPLMYGYVPPAARRPPICSPRRRATPVPRCPPRGCGPSGSRP
ncbi:MmgE/PrpD family protein [Streptomyces luteoverticillatus]|uniref:MmgE/PrpD family protein n=1 Tax=Streptomyces luteoverticillatus TaxID=66425 RepID=UPI0013DF6519|nr:MmgE/PrpD family protein [Streptomyces luteoverticillatus]